MKYWTPEEIRYLRKNWDLQSDQEIATHLNRTARSVGGKRLSLTLCPLRDNPRTVLSIKAKIRRMKELIALCEANPSPPVKDGYKRELMKLSGLW